jgi:hypothetical protein
VDAGCAEAVGLLVSHGADARLCDKQGKTPYDLAISPQLRSALDSSLIVDVSAAGSFNQASSHGVSPNATNFISEGGEEHPLFDTFGIDKLKAVKTCSVRPIFNWLKEIGLEELYEIICDAGYDDLKAMAAQMIGPMPITEQDLEECGVGKVGHRVRIIMKLEQEAGIMPRLRLHKSAEDGGFLRCCMVANNATNNLVNTNLLEWLEGIGAGNCYQQFVDTGFDHYESLIMITASSRPMNSRFLEEVIGLKSSECRSKILKRLEKDLKKFYSTSASVNVSFDEPKTVACDSCVIS